MTDHSSQDCPHLPRRRPLRTITNYGIIPPFRQRQYEANFPPFDRAFAARPRDPADKSSTTRRDFEFPEIIISNNDENRSSNSSRTNDEYDNQLEESINHNDDHDDDTSNASDGDELSIGARAAIQEHLRHVARYGVDGGEPHHHQHHYSFHYDIDEDDDIPNTSRDDSGHSHCRHSESEINENQRPVEGINYELANPHEVIWNHLLDTTANSSSSSSYVHSFRDRKNITKIHNFNPDVEQDTLDDEGVEVSLVNTSTCYSDYFNTSNVWLLSTPEKVKMRPHPILTTTTITPTDRARGHRNRVDVFDNNSFHSSVASTNLSHILASLHRHQNNDNSNHLNHHMDEDHFFDDDHIGNDDTFNESFAAGVDVSRISAADSEEHGSLYFQKSPNGWDLVSHKHDLNNNTATTPQRRFEQRQHGLSYDNDNSFESILSPPPIINDAAILSPICHPHNDNKDFISGHRMRRTLVPRPQYAQQKYQYNPTRAHLQQHQSPSTSSSSQSTKVHFNWLSHTDANNGDHDVIAVPAVDYDDPSMSARIWTRSKASPQMSKEHFDEFPPLPRPLHKAQPLLMTTSSRPASKTQLLSLRSERSRPHHEANVHSLQHRTMAFPKDDSNSVASSFGGNSRCFRFSDNDSSNYDFKRTLLQHCSSHDEISSPSSPSMVGAMDAHQASMRTTSRAVIGDDDDVVSLNVSAIEKESDCDYFDPQYQNPTTVSSWCNATSSSAANTAAGAVIGNNNNNSSSSSTSSMTRQTNIMDDRRRYRTVVPNRVLFDETDDNHYHHCRDDSFSA